MIKITILSSIVLLSAGGLIFRSAWIDEKSAALSSEPSKQYQHENFVLPPKGSRPRIVLIGDSRIAQWPSAAWPEIWEVINRGIGGETAAQLSKRFLTDAIALAPDVIVIETGINDLVAASFLPEQQKRAVAKSIADNLRAMVDSADAAGCILLMISIIPSAKPGIFRRLAWNQSLVDLVVDVNTVLRHSSFPGRTRLVDVTQLLVVDDNTILADKYRRDTLHLNQNGYAQLSIALVREVRLALTTPDPLKR